MIRTSCAGLRTFEISSFPLGGEILLNKRLGEAGNPYEHYDPEFAGWLSSISEGYPEFQTFCAGLGSLKLVTRPGESFTWGPGKRPLAGIGLARQPSDNEDENPKPKKTQRQKSQKQEKSISEHLKDIRSGVESEPENETGDPAGPAGPTATHKQFTTVVLYLLHHQRRLYHTVSGVWPKLKPAEDSKIPDFKSWKSEGWIGKESNIQNGLATKSSVLGRLDCAGAGQQA
ncbi:hypothetical protein V8F20_004168 [Naviculisporaceae sp. PSN 640]